MAARRFSSPPRLCRAAVSTGKTARPNARIQNPPSAEGSRCARKPVRYGRTGQGWRALVRPRVRPNVDTGFGLCNKQARSQLRLEPLGECWLLEGALRQGSHAAHQC
jgi:hypothetical protein